VLVLMLQDPASSQRQLLASPSELLVSPNELLASPSKLLASPSELLASPIELLASPTSSTQHQNALKTYTTTTCIHRSDEPGAMLDIVSLSKATVLPAGVSRPLSHQTQAGER
jgi:hypothetical protein